MYIKRLNRGGKMNVIRNSNENEMILEFLKGEIKSNRFNKDLYKVLNELNIDENIIVNGNINKDEENKLRLNIMNKYRGYPNKELFENFPNIYEWKYAELNSNDIDKIYYIDYDYWNILSNNTSKSTIAAKVINSGKEVFDVSNKQYIDGLKYLDNNKFPPIILITCNEIKYLIIEGHLRMTVYGLDPSKLNNTYAYIGYCSIEDMKKYDIRMLEGESLNSRKY